VIVFHAFNVQWYFISIPLDSGTNVFFADHRILVPAVPIGTGWADHRILIPAVPIDTCYADHQI